MDDPDCLSNLANATNTVRMKYQLFTELCAQQDPRALGNGKIFDGFPHANEKMRGYFEKRMQGDKIPADWVNESDFEHGVQQ